MGKAGSEEQYIRNKFTIITFVCSIFIIYFHTYNLEVYGIDENSIGIARLTYYFEIYWRKLNWLAVPMFFMVSGILFFRTFEMKRLFEKYKSRFFSIVIPYIVWCTLYYFYFVLCTHIPFIHNLTGGIDVVELSLPAWIDHLWINEYYTLWFLKNLIIFIILTPVIWILLKDHLKKVPTGFIVLLILLLSKTGGRINFPEGLDIYLMGSYIGINHKRILFYRNQRLSWLCGAYVVFSLITAFRFWNLGLEALFFLSIWYMLDLFCRKETALPWWMSITFFTYVAHDVFLEAFEKLFFVIFGNQAVFALIDYIFMPILVAVILTGVAYIIRMKMPSLVWKILTGNR